jgi:hypothetical protein
MAGVVRDGEKQRIGEVSVEKFTANDCEDQMLSSKDVSYSTDKLDEKKVAAASSIINVQTSLASNLLDKASNLLDKENAMPTDGNSPKRGIDADPSKFLHKSHDTSQSLRKTITNSDSDTIESNEEDTSSLNDDESLLNNSSLAPAPFKRTQGPKISTKVVSSAHSFRTAPRQDLSVSTTPFSKKATPRIQNSYTKSRRLITKPLDQANGPKLSVGNKMYDSSLDISSPESSVQKIVKNNPVASQSRIKVASAVKAANAKTSVQISIGKKRSHAEVGAKKPSPRRSKRLRESARVEQKEALEAALSQKSSTSHRITPKNDTNATPSTAMKKNYGKSPSPTISFTNISPNDNSPLSNDTSNSKDLFLGKSVVVNNNQDQDIDLDGCESIVQRDAGPLAVPWGARSGVKARKKSYTMGRKRDRKPFSISSIFDFKF